MKKETSLIFTGDIGFDRYFEGKWADEALLSPELLRYFKTADHVVANVEGALCDVDPSVDTEGKGAFCHVMNPKAVAVLDQLCADIYDYANNHTMDAGDVGITQALAIAKEKGVAKIGAGLNTEDAAKPAVLKEAGGIGIFAVGYQPTCKAAEKDKAGVLSWNDYEVIERTVREIKKENRWCVLVSHGGEEFASMPSPYYRERYLKYLSYGVDVVVAHHPHVPQNYEILPDGRAIFYSLGNFIFDTDYQRAQLNTDVGVLLKLTFTEEKFTFSAVGTKIERGVQHVGLGDLPAIFTNIPAEHYETMVRYAAKVFVHAEKAKQIFLHPENYNWETDKEKWVRNFYGLAEKRVVVPNELNDFKVILPLAEKADGKACCDLGYEAIVRYLDREFERR